MGKRLIRISAEDLVTKTAAFVGKQGAVVLRDGSVFTGNFLEFDSNILSLKDFGGKVHAINAAKSTELVLDQRAPY